MCKRKKIFIVLTIVWMIIIFLHSAMNGDDSSAESGFVGYLVAYIIKPGFGSMSKAMQAEYIESISFIIRKLGHMAEYAILTGLVMGWLYEAKRKLSLLWCLGFSFIYACTDEIHQLFVPGRAGMFTDVLIDMAGALIGMLGVLFVCWLVVKIKAKKE